MSPKTPDDELIYIGELAKIVVREVDTIRKWEQTGKLPKHLLPQRGNKGWRCWTHGQVYGKRGIIEWMKKHDMRPGRAVADPANEESHVLALRRPKYLTNRQINQVRTMVRRHAPLEEIVDDLYPHTKYASKENLAEALRRYFKKQGWTFPPY